MAGPYAPYHPTAKPSAASTTSSYLMIRNSTFSTWILVLILCFMSYLLGVWQHGGRVAPAAFSATSATISTIPCPLSPEKRSSPASSATPGATLDFESHHRQDDAGDAELDDRPRMYPACAANFSEYTPCEDVTRSLRFDRDRLIYRERHCPDKSEQVKCRVPAPYGYRIPFRWPASRDLAWYANVPHKELTVEKAVQNWIQYQGDRFRFPGGGTMFPHGADAYIDDIGELIDLKDGSIRTAIDTGCGVSISNISIHQSTPIQSLHDVILFIGFDFPCDVELCSVNVWCKKVCSPSPTVNFLLIMENLLIIDLHMDRVCLGGENEWIGQNC